MSLYFQMFPLLLEPKCPRHQALTPAAAAGAAVQQRARWSTLEPWFLLCLEFWD